MSIPTPELKIENQITPEKISPLRPDGEILESMDIVSGSVEKRGKILEKQTTEYTSTPLSNQDQEKFSLAGLFSNPSEENKEKEKSTSLLGKIATYGGAAIGAKMLWNSAVENISYSVRNFFSKISFGLINAPEKKPKKSFFDTVKKVLFLAAAAKGASWLGEKFSWGTKLKENFFGTSTSLSNQKSEKKKYPSLETVTKNIDPNTPGKFQGVSYQDMDPFFANVLRGYEKERKKIYKKIVPNPKKIARLKAAQKIFRESEILPKFLQEFCPFMPFQESRGYELTLTSNVGAGGPWQFMPATGKQYGLSGSDFNHPKKSALAARKYLEDIYTSIQKNKYFKILAKKYPDQRESLLNFTTVSSYNTGKGNIYSAFKVLATEENFRNKTDTAAQKPFGLFSLIIQSNNSSNGWRKYAPKKKSGNYGKQSREYVPHILGFYQLAEGDRLV